MFKRIVILSLIGIFVFSVSACAALFENQKIIKALQDGTISIGMSKSDLVGKIGYPPEGKGTQDALFYRFVQTKVTAAGKEESWTYQIGATPDGVRSVTFKLVGDKVQEWNEWLNTNP
jgi:hypothetical protein